MTFYDKDIVSSPVTKSNLTCVSVDVIFVCLLFVALVGSWEPPLLLIFLRVNRESGTVAVDSQE